MTETFLGDPVDVDWLASTVRDLGITTLRFGQVERVTRHEDGKRLETVTTHTVMVGLLACALAERINDSLPADDPDRLDLGVIAQFALIHDLPEVYANDTSTLRLLTDEQLADKHRREQEATARLRQQFAGVLPWVSLTLGFYEIGSMPEADFVWGVDKVSPKITHIGNGCATPFAQGVTVAELAERYAVQREQMLARCGRWPVLIAVYDRLVEEELESLAMSIQAGSCDG